MPSLREKMKQEMTLIGLAVSTQNLYIKALVRLKEHYNKSPAHLSTRDIKEYLTYLRVDRKLAPNTFNVHVCALRFFYCNTLGQHSRRLDLRTCKVTYKLPEILSPNEVQQIIKATSNIKHRTLFITVYGCGLRISEALNLRINDIDAKRKTLHIRHAKGGKSRYAILSPAVHEALRSYWKACPFVEYIFPSQNSPHKPLTKNGILEVFQSIKTELGITKKGGMHSLRHAFATHLLESGEDIFTIKELLGHACIQSTMRYLQFVPQRHLKLCSPIEQLDL